MSSFQFLSAFPQLFVNGVLFGTMYGLAAIGLSLIFGTMKVMFIAQGTFLILIAYGCFWLFKLFSLDPYLSIIILLPLCLLLGLGLYHGLFRRVAKAGPNASLLIAFGLVVLVDNLMCVAFSADIRAIRTSYTVYVFKLLGMTLSFTRLMAFVMASLSALGLTLFLKKTFTGKAVRAASENLESSTLVGIKPQWANGVTFALGIGLAGAAGVATATTYAFDPYMGFVFTLKALIAVALGGMGNIPGALVGGIVLGVVESLATYVVGGGWSEAIAYTLFLAVLMFKPEGIFSRSSSGTGNMAMPSTSSNAEVHPSIWSSHMTAKARIPLLLLVLLALCAVPFILDTETSYIINLLFFCFVYIALSQSWNLIAGYAGQISLGHHAFFGLGAYVTGMNWVYHVTRTGYFFDPLTMFLSGLVPAIFAFLIGTPLLSRLWGDYFALGSLGLGEILRVVFRETQSITGGGMGLFLPSSVYTSMKPYYFTALLLAVLATALAYFMVKSRIGLAFVALREDETAAYASGVNVLIYKVLAFGTSAFLAGLCGSLMAYHLFQVQPDGMFNLNWLLYPLLMCMLGGIGTIQGPILGAILLTGIFELGKLWFPELHQILSGFLIIIVVMFLPDGLIRLKVRRAFRSKRKAY